MPSDALTPAGSAVYNSKTMYVGDGTWDITENTFLLPNLQGLNFETMRYNGMGNRFRAVTQYRQLIVAHGILAAITFLFIVPFAILFIRFGRKPRWAVKVHIWCQILTLLLTTALFIIPFFAVGPERALTNPHHGIGVAIYVLVWIQFIGGWWVYRRERRRKLSYAPVKAVLHRWIGRMIALLALAQIPLGLTLYGSPLYLFVLYALAVFGIVVIYFTLSYLDERNQGRDMNSDYSWASASGSAVSRRRHGRLGTLAKTAAAGAGLVYVANKFRNRNEAVGSTEHDDSFVEEEKHSHHGRENGGGIRNKILGAGALAGLGYWASRLLGRKHDDSSFGSGSFTESSVGGTHPVGDGISPSGQPLNPPPPLGHRQNHPSESYNDDDDFTSSSPSRQPRNHGLRDTVAGIGAFAAARSLFKKRRERKEDKRIETLRQQEIEEERINRADSQRQRYTGDGFPRHGGRRGSLTSTNLSPVPPGAPMAFGAAGAAAGALPGNHSNLSGVRRYVPPTIDGQPLPVVPPPPHAPHGMRHDSSGSEVFTTPDGKTQRRHRGEAEAAAAGLVAGAAGVAGVDAMGHRRDRSRNRRHSSSTGDVDSPRVSVKLNTHSDGRHVTLRRLTEEEAAADRARRAGAGAGLSNSRSGSRRRRAGSGSTGHGPEADRWRRTEDLERQEQANLERQQLQNTQEQLNSGKLAPFSPPPPIPGSSVGGPGSVGSPGTYDGTATEASINYEKNRSRRRAERAQAAQARVARGGGRAEEFQ